VAHDVPPSFPCETPRAGLARCFVSCQRRMKMSKYQKMQSLKKQRRALSDSLTGYTLRHDPLVRQLQDMDVEIEAIAYELGINAWKHDAPINPAFSGAQPARAGEDY